MFDIPHTPGNYYVSDLADRNDVPVAATAFDRRRFKEGRGRGTGGAYRPWIYVWEVPSKGLSWRIYGWTVPRVYHLLSNYERNFFYTLEWPRSVIDIREQFPLLPLAETMAIANELGVRHPAERGRGGLPVVMTTDFVVTRLIRGVAIDQARAIKPLSALTWRAEQKFEIERIYWRRRGVEWSLVSEAQISTIVAENVRYLHHHRDPASLALTSEEILRIGAELDLRIASERTLAQLTLACDEYLGNPRGTALAVARFFIANRRWPVDISRPLHPARPVPVLPAQPRSFHSSRNKGSPQLAEGWQARQWR